MNNVLNKKMKRKESLDVQLKIVLHTVGKDFILLLQA